MYANVFKTDRQQTPLPTPFFIHALLKSEQNVFGLKNIKLCCKMKSKIVYSNHSYNG